MAVVINEFEVVPEAPAPAAAPADRAEPAAKPPPPDVEKTIRTLRERRLRLRAD